MDIKNISYLFAIDELKSISAASKRLFISQPSLSQFLKKYEDDLGYPIFIRTKQGLKLTYEGEIFLDTARNMLQLEHDMRRRLADQSGQMSGTIVFALSVQRAPFLLPHVLPEFNRRFPDVTVKIVEGRTKILEHELQKGTIDLGILVPPLINQSLPCETLLEEELVLAIPKSMPVNSLAHRTPGRLPWMELAQLEDCKFLLYDINNRMCDFIDELFDRCQFRPARSMTFRNLTVIARLASAGMGITFLPETYIDPSYELNYYSVGEHGCFRPIALGYPSSRYRSCAVRQFSKLLKESLQAEQAAFRKRYI